ncbi:MAG: lysylphosphatidylglycerol synthase transmembrane domain-containing protein [Pseudolysinimonas sp.]
MKTDPPGIAHVRRLTSGRVGRVIARAAAVVILAVLVAVVVVPQYGDALQALHSVSLLSPFPLVLGLALELGSLAALGALTRVALDPPARPGYPTILRIDLTGVAVTNAVPGGGATALAVRYRFLTRAGMPSGAVAGGLAVEATVSNLVLGALFAIGILLSVGSLPSSPYYWLAGGIILLVFGTVGVALTRAVRRPAGAVALARSLTRALSVARQDKVAALVEAVVSAVGGFAFDRRRLVAAVSWSVANWLLDATALWMFLAAFGYRLTPGHLLLAYGLAAILALIPITPGGFGVIEGVLVPTVVAMGSPYAIAVLGVTAWRLVQFWMPIPLGGISALTLVAGSSASDV